MEPILIREAGIEDLPYILHHRESMFRDMGKQDEHAIHQMLLSAEAFLREAMPRGGYRAWLAEVNGRVIAGAGITIVDWPGSPDDPHPRHGWIQNVYTEAEFRRQGLARRLMDTIVEWCREEGFITVSLHASAFGRRLYEDMGFEQTNEMRLRL